MLRGVRAGATAVLLLACNLDDAAVGDVSTFDAPHWYEQPSRVDAPEASDAWTMVLLPDTQDYTRSEPEVLASQVDWILAQRDNLDIRFVAHLGDIVQRDRVIQWEVARAELGRLVGEVPFCLPPGNHDLFQIASRRTSMLDMYFSWPELGHDNERGGALDPNSIWNTYHVVDGAGGPVLVLALEFGPRLSTLAWANGVIEDHPQHTIVVVTHAYLYSDELRYDWRRHGREQGGNPHVYPLDDVSDGEEVWRGLVSRHANIRLVVSGHAMGDGLGRQTSTTLWGTQVHELLSNYQRGVVHRGQARASSGYLRLLHFEDDDRLVDVATYSPWLGTWLNDEDNRFELELSPVRVGGPPRRAH